MHILIPSMYESIPISFVDRKRIQPPSVLRTTPSSTAIPAASAPLRRIHGGRSLCRAKLSHSPDNATIDHIRRRRQTMSVSSPYSKLDGNDILSSGPGGSDGVGRKSRSLCTSERCFAHDRCNQSEKFKTINSISWDVRGQITRRWQLQPGVSNSLLLFWPTITSSSRYPFTLSSSLV